MQAIEARRKFLHDACIFEYFLTDYVHYIISHLDIRYSFWIPGGRFINMMNQGPSPLPRSKVIYPKYSKNWPYTVVHTIDFVCSKMLNHRLNHGLFLSLFKLIPCPIHWIVYVLLWRTRILLLTKSKGHNSNETYTFMCLCRVSRMKFI